MLALRRLCVGAAESQHGGAKLLQVFRLLLHQRDQRRDDETHTLGSEHGELVDERLSRPGWHQHKRRATCLKAVDRIKLTIPK